MIEVITTTTKRNQQQIDVNQWTRSFYSLRRFFLFLIGELIFFYFLGPVNKAVGSLQ
jgi:hypothetical protein